MNPVLTIGALAGLAMMGLAMQVLRRRRTELLEFLSRAPHRIETFDEVVWGLPRGQLPEATSWVLLSGALLFVGGFGAVSLTLSLLALARVAPLVVLPAMGFAWAAWAGWQGLASQVGRLPVVRRLRLSQPHLVLDEVHVGLRPTSEEIEAAPLGLRRRTIAWADVTDVAIDRDGCLVLSVRHAEPAHFGPLPDDVAEAIAVQIRRRRGAEETGGAEIVDLARARLRSLTERADRTPPDDAPPA